MSVLRKLNVLGQLRIDAPHIRSLESAINADFDVVVGRGMAGSKPLVLRGFTLANIGAGTLSSQVQLLAADGILFNVNALEAGSFLWVPPNRPPELLSASNPRMSGSFTASTTNYVGVSFKRSADATTADLTKFYNPSAAGEISKTIPLGLTLDYQIVISTAPFSTALHVVPIAKIVTDSANKVVEATDARPLFYRLGSGGDLPNANSSYIWPFGRNEAASTTTFAGGDKNITSQKDWNDAVMTRLWELGGGQNWYSPTADRNVKLVRAPPPSVFSSGDNFELAVGDFLHWQGLRVAFDNANQTGVYYNDIADSTTNDADLNFASDGMCWYVDIDRTQNLTGTSALTVKREPLQTLSTPITPGSRFVIAWATVLNSTLCIYTRDSALYVGTSYPVATTASAGSVVLQATPGNPAAPKVVTVGVDGRIVIPAPTAAVETVNATGAASGVAVYKAQPFGADKFTLDANFGRISNLPTPLISWDAANKSYVDSIQNFVQNANFKISQRAPGGYGATIASTSAFGGAARSFPADRWHCFRSGVGTGTSTNPSVLSTTVAKVQITPGDATLNKTYLVQEIDRSLVAHLAGKPVTINFYAIKGANFSGTFKVKLLVGTVVSERIFDNRTTTAHYSTTPTTPRDSTVTLTGTLDQFSLTANPTVVSAAAKSAAIVFEYTPDAVAGADDSFIVSNVSLMIGMSDPIAEGARGFLLNCGDSGLDSSVSPRELLVCQKFFEAWAGGEVNPPFRTMIVPGTYVAAAPILTGQNVLFRVLKRATPVVSYYDVNGPLSGGFGGQNTGDATTEVTKAGFTFSTASPVTYGSNEFASAWWYADAEI